MADSPSGRQLSLHHDDQVAVIVELGAALRLYTVGERPVIRGFASHEQITGGRGQLLVPWPNRVIGGRYRWKGLDMQLPLTEPEKGNAIHGLLRWISWDVMELEANKAVLGATVWPQPGYPFHLQVRAEYALGAEGLAVTVTARNLSRNAAPYGVGQHPYLEVGTNTINDAVLTVPARTWLRTDGRGAPIGSESVAGTAHDFRTPRAVGAHRLDTAFAELERDDLGRAVVSLAHPSGVHGTRLWLGEGADFVQVFTGDTLAEEERRRSIAIEPMSCPPDAFRSGMSLVELGPGAQHTLRWGLTSWQK